MTTDLHSMMRHQPKRHRLYHFEIVHHTYVEEIRICLRCGIINPTNDLNCREFERERDSHVVGDLVGERSHIAVVLRKLCLTFELLTRTHECSQCGWWLNEHSLWQGNLRIFRVMSMGGEMMSEKSRKCSALRMRRALG